MLTMQSITKAQLNNNNDNLMITLSLINMKHIIQMPMVSFDWIGRLQNEAETCRVQQDCSNKKRLL